MTSIHGTTGVAATRLLIGLAVASGMAACSDPPPTAAAAQEPSAPQHAQLQLDDGAPSVEALLDQLIAAVNANDEQALHHLRVNEQQYRAIMVPWTVEAGQPPRPVREETVGYFWRMLDLKSRDLGREMLVQFGGRNLTRKDPTFTKSVQKFAGYNAYGQLRLPVVNDDGKEAVLRSGTIAEVNGRYKFIGLNWDD